MLLLYFAAFVFVFADVADAVDSVFSFVCLFVVLALLERKSIKIKIAIKTTTLA